MVESLTVKTLFILVNGNVNDLNICCNTKEEHVKPGNELTSSLSVNHKAKIDDRADTVQVRAISRAC